MRYLLMLLALPAMLLPQAETPQGTVVVLVGSPASGKTTQARNIKKKYKLPTISMPELLKKSAGWKVAGHSKELASQRESGELVNDEMANQMVAERLLRNDVARGFVLDGYPSNARQAQYLERMIKNRDLPPPLVILIHVPENVALERMQQRGRADDKPETMRRRLDDFGREKDAIMSHFQGRVKIVDGTKSEADVWREIDGFISSSRP